jgi:outer membrane protein assembly factor BamB
VTSNSCNIPASAWGTSTLPDTAAEVDTTPVIHQGKVLVGHRGAGLSALDEETGKELWRTFFWESWVESTPVVHAGTIYIGSSDLRRVSAIDPANGKVLWRSDVFGWTWGTPLVDGDRLHWGSPAARRISSATSPATSRWIAQPAAC